MLAVLRLSLSSVAPPCTKLQKSISMTPAIFFSLIAGESSLITLQPTRLYPELCCQNHSLLSSLRQCDVPPSDPCNGFPYPSKLLPYQSLFSHNTPACKFPKRSSQVVWYIKRSWKRRPFRFLISSSCSHPVSQQVTHV